MSDKDRADRAKKAVLEPQDLAPLSEEELVQIRKRFAARMGEEAELPAQNESIEFSNTIFSKPVFFEKLIFENDANFISAMFTGYANFNTATFTGDVDFRFATFTGDADFRSAIFTRDADFSSARFESATRFTDAEFLTSVPQFHATALYDDTVFSCRDQDQGKWPPLREAVTVNGETLEVMPAAEQKRAYNRLRLFMNKSLQLDEEQFCHRQEMRCKTRLASWYHKPLYWLYGGLSDFGNSVVRPIVGIFAVICLGALFMLWWQGVLPFRGKRPEWTGRLA